MTLKSWDNSFSVNISSMDDDHVRLVQKLRTIYYAISLGRDKEVVSPLIDNLQDYASTHFSREEKLLQEKNHPDIDMQKSQHKFFLEKIHHFETHFQNETKSTSISLLSFLNQWVLNHILKVDMNYKPH
jgi:hemerythrin